MNETKEIKLNSGEANDLLVLIDAGVRARGLEVAEAALVLSKRIRGAFAMGPLPQTEKTNTQSNTNQNDNN